MTITVYYDVIDDKEGACVGEGWIETVIDDLGHTRQNIHFEYTSGEGKGLKLNPGMYTLKAKESKLDTEGIL